MRLLPALLLGWPLLVSASDHQADWVREWPLSLAGEAGGAYRLTLDPAMYRSAQDATVGDLQVFDARGVAVPTAVMPEDAAADPVAAALAVPWFPLPAPEAEGGARWELISETDAQGRLRRVETRGLEESVTRRPDGAALVDVSAVDKPLLALELAWPDSRAPVDTAYRVEASDDLERWRTVRERGRLLDLTHQGHRIIRRQLMLGGVSAPYLRLRPTDGEAPLELDEVRAVPMPVRAERPWQWLALDGQRQAEGSVDYRLDGRFPVVRADVELVSGTGIGRWTLWSRDDEGDDWRRRSGPWVGYRLDDESGEVRSPPREIAGPVRDRHWRLTTEGEAAGATPILRLGYRPERVVFLAQGEAPFSLAAGSVRARRAEAPVATVLASLREQRGEAWRPAMAAAGAARELAGERALRPARDWTTWLLWAVLGGGAALVAGLALGLLRQARG